MPRWGSNRLRIVRNFCLYRRRTTPTGFVPDPALFPPPHPPRRPYIFTEGEIARLLRATRMLARTPSSPLRPDVFRLALVLLYTTGLRRGRAGEDPQAKLPLLATYMGHVSIVSTHYYLPFVEPLGTAANLRFAARYGTLLGPGPAQPGGGALAVSPRQPAADREPIAGQVDPAACPGVHRTGPSRRISGRRCSMTRRPSGLRCWCAAAVAARAGSWAW
jgi:hypothetical protein